MIYDLDFTVFDDLLRLSFAWTVRYCTRFSGLPPGRRLNLDTDAFSV